MTITITLRRSASTSELRTLPSSFLPLPSLALRLTLIVDLRTSSQYVALLGLASTREFFDVIDCQAEVVVEVFQQLLQVVVGLGDGDADCAAKLAFLVNAEREMVTIPDNRILDAGRATRLLDEACHTLFAVHVQVAAHVLYYVAEFVALLCHSQVDFWKFNC